jgi:hypothetical protein
MPLQTSTTNVKKKPVWVSLSKPGKNADESPTSPKSAEHMIKTNKAHKIVSP